MGAAARGEIQRHRHLGRVTFVAGGRIVIGVSRWIGCESLPAVVRTGVNGDALMNPRQERNRRRRGGSDGDAGEGQHDAGATGDQETTDDTTPGDEQPQQRAGENRDLPKVPES